MKILKHNWIIIFFIVFVSCKKESLKTNNITDSLFTNEEIDPINDSINSNAEYFSCGEKELSIETIKTEMINGKEIATVKVTLPDGKIIEMKEKLLDNGFWFSNSEYDLKGIGDSINIKDKNNSTICNCISNQENISD